MPRPAPCSHVATGSEKPWVSHGNGRGIVHPNPSKRRSPCVWAKVLGVALLWPVVTGEIIPVT